MNIILAPVITEKSESLKANNVYVFKVNKKATKVDVKMAVEKLFGVKVTNVNTSIVKGTLRNRNGRQYKMSCLR